MAPGTHVEIGQILIAIAEPHRKTLDEYHAWFERDHMYSAVLIGPGAFAANRYKATRDLKALRYPADGNVFPKIDSGAFVALYYIAKGFCDEHFAWSFAQTERLGAEGRNNPDRELTLTWLCDFEGAVARDANSVPPEIALDHPYAGIVMTWIDRTPETPIDELERWLLEEALPPTLTDSPVDQVLLFSPRDFPAAATGTRLTPGTIAPNLRAGEGLLLIHFLEQDPRAAWKQHFAALGESIAASGRGRVALVAPFVPTPRGRRARPDELW